MGNGRRERTQLRGEKELIRTGWAKRY